MISAHRKTTDTLLAGTVLVGMACYWAAGAFL
jgi:hypothetical protein